MPSIVYSSKQWTVGRAIGFLRILLNQLAPDKIQTLPLVDYINIATQDVAALLDEVTKKEDYGANFIIKDGATGVGQVELVVDPTPFLTASADISVDAGAAKLRIDRITSISYTPKAALSSPQNAIFVSPLEFENLLDVNQKNKEVFYYLFGEKLFILNRYETIAFETDWGSLKVYYNRFPVKLTVDNDDRLGDTLDIRDSFVDLTLAKAKMYIYEELAKTPPESLASVIEAGIKNIKDSLKVEDQFLNDKSKKNQS
ncbi:MAG: phage adaptor protein [Candidatus Aquicultor sp.]